MQKVLVPVDGSRNALHAVRHVIDEFAKKPDFEVHVLNVQAPFSRHIARFVSKNDRDSYHRDQAEHVLGPIRKMLDDIEHRHGAKAADVGGVVPFNRALFEADIEVLAAPGDHGSAGLDPDGRVLLLRLLNEVTQVGPDVEYRASRRHEPTHPLELGAGGIDSRLVPVIVRLDVREEDRLV